ncbi:hypothetical protein MKW98_003431 [Papaver atlanticum]|uniref:Uncharacterized protein n=1 Tax=Papaver atlanticum TaxID=357466 RepID=A0AAD4TBB1_9MAGN|nr:hypothetical protein MKW98_003431 [Papaver atlanticum]
MVDYLLIDLRCYRFCLLQCQQQFQDYKKIVLDPIKLNGTICGSNGKNGRVFAKSVCLLKSNVLLSCYTVNRARNAAADKYALWS